MFTVDVKQQCNKCNKAYAKQEKILSCYLNSTCTEKMLNEENVTFLSNISIFLDEQKELTELNNS